VSGDGIGGGESLWRRGQQGSGGGDAEVECHAGRRYGRSDRRHRIATTENQCARHLPVPIGRTCCSAGLSEAAGSLDSSGRYPVLATARSHR
jgi:hypothetical protein